jgi:hypothetical protein
MGGVSDQNGMHKRIGRAILATFVALSVAMLPIAAGFVASSQAVAAPAVMSMPDCIHHHAMPSDPTQKAPDGCDTMAACALKCFNMTADTYSSLAYSSSPSAKLEPVRMDNKFVSRMGSPPFRPPRS